MDALWPDIKKWRIFKDLTWITSLAPFIKAILLLSQSALLTYSVSASLFLMESLNSSLLASTWLLGMLSARVKFIIICTS